MRWKAKYTRTDYAHGTTRMKRVFAWWPTYVTGDMVWLETYEVLQAYIIKEHKVDFQGENNIFGSGEWKNISKRLFEK